jgi:ATP-dependent DNA helicase RecQ
VPAELPPLRPFQKSAIELLEGGGNLVCVSPTGSGKSRIYEEILLRSRPRTLLFTPLLALARQQESSLREMGIPAFGKFSAQARPRGRESGVWSLRPESLLHRGTWLRIRAWRPQFLVVDECHCCWDWGEAFRPAFRQILDLASELRPERSLWLTATLPGPARELLGSRLSPRFMGEFDLPEGLRFRALRVPWPERSDALLGWLSRRQEPGIVFVSTREMSERLARLVRATGREALAYHAGLSKEERAAIEDRLRSGGSSGSEVVVATSAFGMGMHFPRLGWALLWQAPPSLLGLAQSIGRVGRGSMPAEALMLWDEDDFRLIEWMAQGSRSRGRELAEVREFVLLKSCRVRALREFFGGEPREGSCGRCDACENFTRT